MKKIIAFMRDDVWRIRLKNLSRWKSFLLKQLRVILLAFRSFDEDKCQLRASALTFYSLLSIVPVAAMVFGIAKGFGFEKMLEKLILEQAPGQQVVLTQVITFAQSMLENTKGGVVAGVGVVILFWTVIKVLGNIEKSFNDIWGVKKARSMGRKFSDYLSIMLICPVLLIASSGATVFITTQITFLTEKIALLGALRPLISFLLKCLPYGVIWILFVFVYIFMPNTKVNFKSAFLAGIAAGTIYEIVQWAYIAFQVGVAKYNAIYGSFAALPLFLMWLQLSWLILLFGAEVSFAHQNVEFYEFEPDCLRASHSFRMLLSLRIANFLVKNFAKGETALTAASVSHALEIPIRLSRELLHKLVGAAVLSEVNTDDYREVAYQPARDIDTISIKFVIDALERKGVDTIPIAPTQELNVLSGSLQSFSELVTKSTHNKLLKDI